MIFLLRTSVYRNEQWQFPGKDFSDCCIFEIPAVPNQTADTVLPGKRDSPDQEAVRNKYLPLELNGVRQLLGNQGICVLQFC